MPFHEDVSDTHQMSRYISTLSTLYFDFYITGMCLYNCFYSGWVNSYDGYFDYTVPPGHVMRGWTSIHDNGAEYVVKLW